jgi:hypothetical protein
MLRHSNPTTIGMSLLVFIVCGTLHTVHSQESPPPVTLVSFLLDETGSMESIKDDTIGGFNRYLASLQAPDAGTVEFTLVKFDSNKIDKVYVGVPVGEAQPLTTETYRPGAATPLIDAAVKLIKATEEALTQHTASPRVLLVIQTDGHENASREYTLTDLQDLIKAKTAAGWHFVFLGAGIDAFTQVASWGIPTSNTLSYGREHSDATFQALSTNTHLFLTSGAAQTLEFNAGQRQEAGDAYHRAAQPPTHTGVPIVDDIILAPQSPPGTLSR